MKWHLARDDSIQSRKLNGQKKVEKILPQSLLLEHTVFFQLPKIAKVSRHGNLKDSSSSINTKHIITIVNKGYSGLRTSAHMSVDQAALYQYRMEVPFHFQSDSLLAPVSSKTKFLIFITNEVHVPLTHWYATHLHTNGYIRNSQHN